MVHVLRVIEGDEVGRDYSLDKDEVLIGRRGRSDGLADIILDGKSVSRRHARLFVDGDAYVVEDVGSTNGTYVNGKRIDRARLEDHDRVRIGHTIFSYRSSPPLAREQADDHPIIGVVQAACGTEVLGTANVEGKLQAMLHIAQTLVGNLDLGSVLSTILDNLLEIFPNAERVLLLLLEDGRLVPQAARQRRDPQDCIEFSRTIVEKAMADRQAILYGDMSPAKMPQTESIKQLDIRSVICAPLLSREREPLGIIQLDTTRHRSKFRTDDVQILTAVAAQASIAIENARLHREVLRRVRLEEEVKLARALQQALLPRAVPKREGYEFWAHYLAAGEVGGDFYDFLRLPSGNQAALLADVSGKGIPAALMMSRASAICRTAMLSHPDDVGAALTEMNREICEVGVGGKFVTLVLCVLDPQTHEVTLASAGHMSPILRRADVALDEPLQDQFRGCPLGIAAGNAYQAATTVLAPGEYVVLFSDGISEAMNAERAPYGVERIRQVLAAIRPENAAAVGAALLEDVSRHVGDSFQSDDITLLVFGRNPAPPPPLSEVFP